MALPQPQIPHQQHHHARQLSRLNINAASFNPGGPETALFTPHGFATAGPQSAFPFSANPMQQQQQHLQQQRTIGHHGSHPSMSMSMSMHRSRPSLANIPGFMPPMSAAVPMTAGPHMANFPVNPFPVPPTPGGSQQQFPNQQPPHQQPYRQRRQQSISIGGPPRAALGGPQRKATTPTPAAAATSTVVEGKVRKVVVKLPKETLEDEPTEQDQEGNPVASSSRSRPTWARSPIPPDSLPEQALPAPPQIASVEIYPSHSPEEEEGGGDSAESSTAAATVVLPRRNAWDVYRKNIIEEKLAKLGVEPSGFPGLGPALPVRALPPQVLVHHHNRASSVSTPADPALLARHALQGNRQTPSPLSVAPPLSALPTQTGAAATPTESRPLNALAPAFNFGGQSSSPLGPSPRFQALPGGPRGFHGHSLSLAAPSFTPPNPYLAPGFGIGSTNPFGKGAVLGGDGSQGVPSLSVSPQPGTLPSVSEYEEDEEAAVESSSAAEGPKIHAPKPLGMLHLRPVFVSHQSSPAPSSAPEIREDGNDSAARLSPPVTATGPAAHARDLSTADFMRGFGIESDLEGDANDEVPAEAEEVSAEPSPQPGLGLPIVAEVERDLLIAAEDTLASGPTPTAARFPTDVATTQEEEEEAIEEAVQAVDPADDADEEDVSSERGDEAEEVDTELEEEVAEDNYTTPSHSRHVSKVSMAPSLAEMGPAAVAAAANAAASGRAGMREFRFGGSGVREEEGEELEEDDREAGYLNEDASAPAAEGWTGRLVSDDETESIGEWSNPSDEERARQEQIHRRLLREQAKITSQDLSGFVARPAPYENHDLTIRSEQSFVSNPSNDPDQSDDIVSNPSDDEYAKAGMTFGGGILAAAQVPRESNVFAQIGADFNPVVQRPLPPLPHSRNTSAQFPQAAASPSSHHHSPAPSTHTATPVVVKNNIGSLNPLARPFVFGARPGSDSFSLQSPSTAPGTIPLPNSAGLHKPSHSRQLSVTSKLNIAAPEFKPGGTFMFTPIEGVPRLPMPAPGDENETSRPLPEVPTSGSPSYSMQGREKRQRLDDSPKTATFQFPRPWSPSQAGDAKEPEQEPESAAPLDSSLVNIHAKPFTIAGLVALKAEAPIRSLTLPESKSEQQSPSRGNSPDPEAAQRAMSMPTSTLASPPRPEQALPGATSAFGRPSPRLPIPDFSHPTSSNTVPAGLFKALHADAEGPTRPTVRSRLASRDFFEHANRRSLDDINVPLISKKMASKVPAPAPSAAPVFSLPAQESSAPALALAPPPRAKERRSSAPAQQTVVVEVRAPSPAPLASPSITSSIVRDSGEAVEQFEGRMEDLLDDKISQLREDIASLASTKSKDADDLVNAAIGQLVTSFRTQMMDYMKKVTETNMSRADAHVELNQDLVKAAIEEGHENIRASVLREIERLQPTQRAGPPMEVLHAIEDLRSVVTETTSTATQTLLAHVDATETFAQRRLGENHQALLRDLSALILPRLAAIRPEPFDVDAVTEQLAEAVKPHISQLIDLASDKKETAVLITQQLSPLLHALIPRFDLDSMAHQVAMDVAQINPPTDPHVLKEEVADLVIERLDARLSIRDSTFSPDAIATRVSKIVGPLNDLANIPSASSVEALNTRQESLLQQSGDLISRQDELAGRLANVPDSLAAASKALTEAKADLEEKSKWLGELEEVKKLASANADLQTQLSKARSAHGQVRSEKDLLAERLQSTEQEREQMKAEIEALKAAAASRDAELKAAQLSAATSEAALAQALERVNTSSAAEQEMKERVARLEEKNQQAQTEIQELGFKVKDLEFEAKQAASEKDTALQAQARLEAEAEALRSESQNWEDLRKTAEKVELLSQLIGAADSEEVADLRRTRDRHRILEKEFNSLEKRCADQEAKIATLQRTTAANKQTIAQTQQKASEWEKRARTAEGELESTQTELEQAREIQNQLEVDLNTMKDDLENNNAALAISNDNETELQKRVTSLESQLSALRKELHEAWSLKPSTYAPKPQSAVSSPWHRSIAVPNGRPGSRTSTVRDETRPDTTTPNGKESPSPPDTPPAQDLWASIHAPKRHNVPVPRPRYSTPVKAQQARNRVASPTPSIVSLAATERADGWWS
ncbi:hypothetical protein FRC04_003618 [Tulasnella sp. 424]|nr:hypothetical protein FRC04_003618 [Tulasnella sp. 424]KAG8965269.1 hypothetical protein FRC05_003320 [Tulasnella sp. 425]